MSCGGDSKEEGDAKSFEDNKHANCESEMGTRNRRCLEIEGDLITLTPRGLKSKGTRKKKNHTRESRHRSCLQA